MPLPEMKTLYVCIHDVPQLIRRQPPTHPPPDGNEGSQNGGGVEMSLSSTIFDATELSEYLIEMGLCDLPPVEERALFPEVLLKGTYFNEKYQSEYVVQSCRYGKVVHVPIGDVRAFCANEKYVWWDDNTPLSCIHNTQDTHSSAIINNIIQSFRRGHTVNMIADRFAGFRAGTKPRTTGGPQGASENRGEGNGRGENGVGVGGGRGEDGESDEGSDEGSESDGGEKVWRLYHLPTLFEIFKKRWECILSINNSVGNNIDSFIERMYREWGYKNFSQIIRIEGRGMVANYLSNPNTP